MISIRQHMYRAGREEFRRSWILAYVMSELQRTRVHCFHAVLEENFAGCQKENNYRHQRRGRENKRRSISHDRGVQAYHHAAGKCHSHR